MTDTLMQLAIVLAITGVTFQLSVLTNTIREYLNANHQTPTTDSTETPPGRIRESKDNGDHYTHNGY